MNNNLLSPHFVLTTSDNSTSYYSPASSSVCRFSSEPSEIKEGMFNDDCFSTQQSTEACQSSFQTSNFKSAKYTIAIRKEVLDYIALKEKEAKDRIVSQYANEIRVLIQQDEFFDGIISRSEHYVMEAYERGQLDYVADAIMSVYSSSLSDAHTLEGILTMISCVPYDAIEPEGQVMARGLLTHKELAVRDKAVQCFERWNSKKGLDYLKNIDCSPSWLQKYVEKVIMYIERDGTE